MSGVGATLRAWRDVEYPTFDADGIVVGNNPGIFQTKDAFEICTGGELAPSGRRIGRGFGEAAVVVFDHVLEDVFSLVDRGGPSKPEFGNESILKGAPEAFDAAAGLRGVGEEEPDTEFIKSPSDLRGFGFTLELFFEGQILFVRDEDGVAIGVGGDRETMGASHALEDREVTCGIFLVAKGGGNDFGGGIVYNPEEAEARPASFEPIVSAAISEDHETGLRHPLPTFSMFGRPMFSWRGNAVLPKDESQGFLPDPDFFDLGQFFMQMGVVESLVSGFHQMNNFTANRF